ncbi:hypothetical protein [Peribacillus sp. CSMR9]|uniref:hypothetical protein n=1 Tax=Peribacillus sp. CSMR9 TaxID=2981350 RepID=UPI002953CE14|nr:hypothetical protein [Peribacillus sp. CSMR9]MDV7765923.1 hypothetical protein [Peribacillus sp. CSMR9]
MGKNFSYYFFMIGENGIPIPIYGFWNVGNTEQFPPVGVFLTSNILHQRNRQNFWGYFFSSLLPFALFSTCLRKKVKYTFESLFKKSREHTGSTDIPII